jgi:hypothetical protein
MTIINTRADYDAAPQQDQARFLKMLAAGAKSWQWQDGAWQLATDMTGAGAFGFTADDLPDVPDPPQPEQTPQQREYEQAAEEVRAKRDGLLKESDYMVLPDAPVDAAKAKVYRQALRDITEQAGFPHKVEWPVF